jgi:hypothetical protein
LCAELVARGPQVIRFGSRDAGLSSHSPDLPAALAGDTSSASCTLFDMHAVRHGGGRRARSDRRYGPRPVSRAVAEITSRITGSSGASKW